MTTQTPPLDMEEVLRRARGASAKIWQFSPSLGRLAIQIYWPKEREQLYLICISCKHISGPFHWTNSHLEIAEKDPHAGPTLIRDSAAGFELRCGGASLLRSTMDKFDLSKDDF
jgi:hypothetical protein